MIDYLTHPRYIKFNPNILPSRQGGAGGMCIRTYRIREALQEVYPSTRLIANAGDIKNEVVFIEPIRFSMKVKGAFEYNDTLLTTLNEYKADGGKVVLLCSEYTLAKIHHALRDQLVALADDITYNTRHQASKLQYVGIQPTHYAGDPIPDYFFDPVTQKRENMVVAWGQVSWQKNSDMVRRIFKRLKGKVKRMYIGSSALWSNTPEPYNRKLQEALYSECDEVVEEATPQDVAKHLRKCAVGLWVAYHDSSAVGAHEAMATGMPVVAMGHGLASELPVLRPLGSLSDAVIHTIKNPDAAHDSSNWVKERCSYSSFQKQIQNVLRGMW